MKTFVLLALAASVHGFSQSVVAIGSQKSVRLAPDVRMAAGLMAEKVGMTQIFNEEGTEAIPVTLLKVGKHVVTQIKTEEKEGYTAIQVGYDEVAERKLNKPQLSELSKSGLPSMRHRVEFHVDDASEFTVGDELKVDLFEEGEKIAVTGTSKGKGFQGTVKRHHFTRGPMAHGSKNHRAPGSIGMGTDPGRILPGKKMAGQMGNKQVTTKGLKIIKVMNDEGVIVVKGAVPGHTGATIKLSKSLW